MNCSQVSTAVKNVVTAALMVFTILAVAHPVSGDTSEKKIALAKFPAGNSWLRAMAQSWERVTGAAVASGIVAAANTYTTREDDPDEQSAQIRKLVDNGYDAIVLIAGSPDGLNAAVKEACDVGVIVVSFDAVVSEPCAWRVNADFVAMGEREIAYLSSRVGGGNLLEIRGLEGVSLDAEISAGIHQAVAETSSFDIAASVRGNWEQDIAKAAVAAVLPDLPEIVAVATQGGDGYGTAQAFAEAGRDMPIIILGNRYEELAWWQRQKEASGYETLSIAIPPGASTLAFWVAQQILEGADVPKDIEVPLLVIDQESLEIYLAQTEPGGLANVEYSLPEAQAIISAQR